MLCLYVTPHLHNSNNPPRSKTDTMQLRDPKGTHAFVQSRSIHVDGGTQRKNKTADTLVHMVVLLQTFYGRRQSSCAEQ